MSICNAYIYVSVAVYVHTRVCVYVCVSNAYI